MQTTCVGMWSGKNSRLSIGGRLKRSVFLIRIILDGLLSATLVVTCPATVARLRVRRARLDRFKGCTAKWIRIQFSQVLFYSFDAEMEKKELYADK